MQVTIYFGDEDSYLIELVDELARRERKSRSAVILSILEDYFSRGKRLGELLVRRGAATPETIEKALSVQRSGEMRARIGEILTELGLVSPEEVERALLVQSRVRT
ncbi:hypothetical protein DRJ54_00145 [Candidatus Acetothermia bacterium]|nr:MAG: hypothetical protein DRJ54_00145 [Candidatus Acetothermia bacterium]